MKVVKKLKKIEIISEANCEKKTRCHLYSRVQKHLRKMWKNRRKNLLLLSDNRWTRCAFINKLTLFFRGNFFHFILGRGSFSYFPFFTQLSLLLCISLINAIHANCVQYLLFKLQKSLIKSYLNVLAGYKLRSLCAYKFK